MNQRLTVQVDADINQLERGLKKGEKSVNRFGNEVQKGEKKVGKFGKTTEVNAVPAMTSFSQVLQDAPYGIQGVANNITQLTSQMGYLAKSSGGAMGALRALGGALIGPAGILLAVSVITSLLVSFGDKLEFAASKAEKLAEATKKYVGEAKAEISNLRVLIGIAEDAANSTDVRRAAIEKINDKYGKYLGNLDLERLKTDEVKAAVDRLTQSLIMQAKIKGLQDLVTEKTSESAEESIALDLKKAQSVKQLENALKQVRGKDYFKRIIGDSRDLNEQINKLKRVSPDLSLPSLSDVRFALTNYNQLNKEIEELEKNTSKALQPLTKLQDKYTKQQLSLDTQLTFSQDEVVIESGGKKPEVKVKPTVDDPELIELNRKISEGLKEQAFLEKELSFIMPFEEAIGEAGYARNLNEAWSTLESQFDEHLDRMTEKTKNFSQKQQVYGQIMAQGFNIFADAVGNALDGSDDAFKDFVKSFLKSASKMILGLIAQSIGNAILGATQASTAAGPLAPFVMPGLIAGSTGVVQGAFGGIPKFNDSGILGGGSYTGDKTLGMFNSGEMILNNRDQNGLWKAIKGNHLGVGGSEPLEISGMIEASGDKLQVILNRADRSRSRRT